MKMHKNGRWKKSVGDMRRRNADEGRGRHRYRSPNRASPPPRHRGGRNNRDASQYSERGRGGGSYCRLIITNIGNKEYPNTIRECLEREFKEYGENMVQVKMDRHGDQIAIATFRSPADARACKGAPGVLELKGRRLQIDALPEDVYDEFHRRSISPAARRSRSPNYFPPRNRGSKMMRNRSDSFEKYGGGGGRGGDRYSKHSPPGRGYLQRGNSRDFTPPRGGKYGRGAAMDYSVSRSPSREYSPEDSNYAAVVDEPPSNPDFCPPEDDPKATRTLFVGNLEPQVNQNEVRRKFEPFGYIETIDFKKANRDNGGGTYCFVRYGNLDMAYNAKIMLNGKAILQNPMHIGYGKINPSVRVWVGGLGQWTKRGDLEQEFDRFGAIKRIDFHRGESCAAILYETMDAAKEACNQMRGFLMPNALTRLKMDFLDPYSEESSYRDVAPDQKRRGGDARRNNEYRRGGSGGYRGRGRGGYRDGGGSGFDRRHKSPDRSGGGSQSTVATTAVKKPSGMNLAEQMQFKRERAKSCYDLYGLCYAFKPACWQGGFLLKNIHFPVHFFLLEGDMGVFNTTTADPTSRTGRRVSFNLSHRLKLDPERLETIRHRLERPVCKERTCLILAVPGVPEDLAEFENISHKPLRGLVKYFKDKDSAAVVKLPLLSRQPVAKDAEGETSKKLSGVLHAFPPSPFVTEQLLKIGPCLQPAQFVDEYLLIYLVKGPQSVVV